MMWRKNFAPDSARIYAYFEISTNPRVSSSADVAIEVYLTETRDSPRDCSPCEVWVKVSENPVVRFAEIVKFLRAIGKEETCAQPYAHKFKMPERFREAARKFFFADDGGPRERALSMLRLLEDDPCGFISASGRSPLPEMGVSPIFEEPTVNRRGYQRDPKRQQAVVRLAASAGLWPKFAVAVFALDESDARPTTQRFYSVCTLNLESGIAVATEIVPHFAEIGELAVSACGGFWALGLGGGACPLVAVCGPRSRPKYLALDPSGMTLASCAESGRVVLKAPCLDWSDRAAERTSEATSKTAAWTPGCFALTPIAVDLSEMFAAD